jgi:small-conductance mechanosensitive channel
VRVNIGVSYEADIQQAKSIIVEVANQMDWIAHNPAPKVVVRNFGDSSVDLQLRVWIRDARRRMDTISFVIDNVKEAFDRNGIEIPYPKRDIQVRQIESPAP